MKIVITFDLPDTLELAPTEPVFDLTKTLEDAAHPLLPAGASLRRTEWINDEYWEALHSDEIRELAFRKIPPNPPFTST